MKQQEKVLLAEIYGVLDSLGGLRARNPADIKTIARYHNDVPRVLRPIMYAVSSLGYGDLEDCSTWLADAKDERAKAEAR